MMNITYILCDASYDDMINILTFMANSKLYTHNLKKKYYYFQFKSYVKKALKYLAKEDVFYSTPTIDSQIGVVPLGNYEAKQFAARFDINNINDLILSGKLTCTKMSLNELSPTLSVTSHVYKNNKGRPANKNYTYPPIAVQIFGDDGAATMIDGTHRVQEALRKKQNIEIYFLPFRQLKPSCFCSYYNYLLYIFYVSYGGIHSDSLTINEYRSFFQDLQSLLNQGDGRK